MGGFRDRKPVWNREKEEDSKETQAIPEFMTSFGELWMPFSSNQGEF